MDEATDIHLTEVLNKEQLLKAVEALPKFIQSRFGIVVIHKIDSLRD